MSNLEKPFKNITKQELDNSKVFCVLPWIHLHVTPFGAAAPCCIAESCSTREGMGDATTLNLMELVNSKQMKQLRLDMLNGVKNDECKKCYEHEEQGVPSWRQGSVPRFTDCTNLVQDTKSDGSLDDFTLKYYDMRFSNICNFKCRTCSQEFSSQWEQENLRNNVLYAYQLPKNNNNILLEDVVAKIDGIEQAYFAGGEPLIMDQHYILLEEMIRRGKTDIELIYNSNISNLKYKNKDIIDLWSHFTKPIQMNASIDHVCERAEYIRHGTDWGLVESNFKKLSEYDFVHMTMNTVLSAFNYLTFDLFYSYLVDNNMYAKNKSVYQIYNMSSPTYYTCHMLPQELKDKGDESMVKTIRKLMSHGVNTNNIEIISTARNWAKSKTITNEFIPETQQSDIDAGLAVTNIQKFRMEIERLDKIRGESFENVFPELKPLLDL